MIALLWRKFARFRSISCTERGHLGQAWVLLASVSLGLRVAGLARVERGLHTLDRWPHTRRGRINLATAPIVWAVETASTYVPGSTCLVRALATGALLRRVGIPAEVEVGMDINAEGELRGHAWVVSNGAIILGGEEDARHYVRLGLLGRRSYK